MTSLKPVRSLPYGSDLERQVLHVLAKTADTQPRPAVVLFHGGGLVAGTPLQDMDWAEPLAEQGYVTFMAGYRLFDERTGENPWPTQRLDAQRAIRWIRAHAAELGVDSERICAMGHSSGGHIAGLLGTTEAPADSDPDLYGLSSRVSCVVTMSGDADLMVPYEDSATTRTLERLLGGTVEETPGTWRDASPAHNVDEGTVPFLIIHGNRDEGVPIEMARNLAAALASADVEYVLAELPAGHMDICSLEVINTLWDMFLAHHLDLEH